MGHPLVALSFVASRGWAEWSHARRHVPLALTATPTRTGGFAFHRVKLILIIFVFFVLLNSVFFLICFYMKYLRCYTSPIKGRWGIAPTGKLLVTDASEKFPYFIFRGWSGCSDTYFNVGGMKWLFYWYKPKSQFLSGWSAVFHWYRFPPVSKTSVQTWLHTQNREFQS